MKFLATPAFLLIICFVPIGNATRFETNPSRPILEARWKTMAPSQMLYVLVEFSRPAGSSAGCWP